MTGATHYALAAMAAVLVPAGRQLAIDADMNAGAIDHAEAKARREREQRGARERASAPARRHGRV